MNNSSASELSDSDGFYYDQSSGHFFPIFNPPLTELLIVSITGFLFCLISLLLYLYVCYVIYRNKSGLFSNVFYTLILHLAFADCLYLTMQIIVGYPVPFFGFKTVSHDFVAACGFVVTVTYWVVPVLVVVIGINRYVAICKFDYYQKMFSKRRIHVTCLCCWGCILVYTSTFYACTCYNYKVGYAWKLSCAKDTCVLGLTYAGLVIGVIFTAMVPVVYCLIFCHYKFKKINRKLFLGRQEQGKMDKRDLNMMLQFTVISSVLMLNFIIFWTYGRESIRHGDIVVSATSCLNSAVNPYLYLFCSSEIRKGVKSSTMIKTLSTPRM